MAFLGADRAAALAAAEEEAGSINMKHKNIIGIWLYGLACFLALLYPVNVDAQTSHASAESIDVKVEAGTEWDVKVTMRLSGQTFSKVRMPAPFVRYEGDNRGFGLKAEDLAIKIDGISRSNYREEYSGRFIEVLFEKPVAAEVLEFDYSISPSSLHNLFGNSVFFAFFKTKNASFLWESDGTGLVLVSSGCYVLDGEIILPNYCQFTKRPDTSLLMKLTRPVQDELAFETAIGFEYEPATTNTGQTDNIFVNQSIAGRRESTFSVIWFLPTSVAFGLIGAYIRKRRNASNIGPIITQFQPPPKMPAVAAGYLLDGRLEYLHLKAALIEAIMHKRVVIEQHPKKDHVRLRRAFDRPIMQHFNDSWPIEEYAIDALFRGGFILDPVSFFKYQPDTHKLYALRLRIEEELISSGLMRKRHRLLTVVPVLIIFAVAWIHEFLSELLVLEALIALIITAILISLIPFVIPRLTSQGREVKRHLLGYKNYLKTVELSRLHFQARNLKLEADATVVSYAVLYGFDIKELSFLDGFIPSNFEATGYNE